MGIGSLATGYGLYRAWKKAPKEDKKLASEKLEADAGTMASLAQTINVLLQANLRPVNTRLDRIEQQIGMPMVINRVLPPPVNGSEEEAK